MNLTEYRASTNEQKRILDLLSLMPPSFFNGLDIGARDGYISECMAMHCEHVTALDLTMPKIVHERIECVQGNITDLNFNDNTFDVVLCAEVLEHIYPELLQQACAELIRVTKRWLIIGVPFNQDIRLGATRCPSCRKTNPPWGHINSFTVEKLCNLFDPLKAQKINFVSKAKAKTNFVTYALMEYADHPYGTYVQDECCIHCGAEINRLMDQRTLTQKLATRAGFLCHSVQMIFSQAQPSWVHILFEKK